MHKMYVVVRDYTGTHGVKHEVGEQIVPGDSTPPEVWAEIEKQVTAGNIREVKESAGVAKPSDKERSNA